MRRRDFITFLAGGMTTWPLTGRAQQKAMPVIGLLHQTSPEQGTRAADEFRQGMRSLGWIEGGTVTIEDRFADGDPVRLAANAAELAAAKPAPGSPITSGCAFAAVLRQ
jgi:putative tryptophan/tyrosine transport system substrate-binding protein